MLHGVELMRHAECYLAPGLQHQFGRLLDAEGPKGRPAKALYGQNPYRGFESLSLRQTAAANRLILRCAENEPIYQRGSRLNLPFSLSRRSHSPTKRPLSVPNSLPPSAGVWAPTSRSA